MTDQKPFIAVGVKGFIKNDKGQYLITKKSDLEDVGPNDYDVPGGRIEFGETPEQALIREAKEEVNLDIEILQIFNSWSFVRDPEFMLVGVDFLCKYVGGDVQMTEEHTGFQWMSVEEIENSNLPGWIKKTVQKAEKLS